jgi:PleD family two-component response regulator
MDDRLGKVLIVDDDLHINELIDMYLQSGGYRTKKCFNGNDACNIVSTEDWISNIRCYVARKGWNRSIKADKKK